MDYAASGIYALTSTKPAARIISILFGNRQFNNSYLAIVQGHMNKERYTISVSCPYSSAISNIDGSSKYRTDAPIGHDLKRAFKMCITQGRNTVTEIQVNLE
jgi:23S rRNA-/tRNA-specific pseudouridylate synthase